jgi:heme/copper-type cytochrome/quinol oxidase subunit 3
MLALDTYIVAVNTVTLLCGGAVTLFAYRAFRRTGSSALRALTVGLGLVATGTLVAGAVHQGLGVSLKAGVAIQSSFTAVGFLVVAYSLFVGEEPATPG